MDKIKPIKFYLNIEDMTVSEKDKKFFVTTLYCILFYLSSQYIV
jgi:hypothetical protein